MSEMEQPGGARSSRATVRNPVLSLPAARKAAALEPAAKATLRDLLLEISDDACQRAQKCWRSHKAPMAVYWKVISIYTRHIARALFHTYEVIH